MFGFPAGAGPTPPSPGAACSGTPARPAWEFEAPHPDPRRAANGEIVVKRVEEAEAIGGCGHGVIRQYIAIDQADKDTGYRTFQKGLTVTRCTHCDAAKDMTAVRRLDPQGD